MEDDTIIKATEVNTVSQENSAEEKKPRRYRAHALVTYLSLDKLKEVLDKRNRQILHHAYIMHDRDIRADGTPKPPHIHVLLYLASAATWTQVRNWFYDTDSDQNTTDQEMRNAYAAFRYLRHLDDPKKVQYSEEEVIVSESDKEWFQRAAAEVASSDTATAALMDALEGRSVREMCITYGRDYIYHKRQIDDCVRDIKWQEGDALLDSLAAEQEFKNKERIKEHIDECHKAIIRLLCALDAARDPDAVEHWRREFDLTKFEPYEKLQNHKGR